ncbi:hypothetical protein [Paenibacillus sp. R14(2021)]|uniref:hypothetical protein n=1 Tax=Paenibacillus sp. R14(2021) TaxID=2859228 RepID=UPI001C611E90|nr:hypothetical protein [Paenibacillus sp. R14(2021)]
MGYHNWRKDSKQPPYKNNKEEVMVNDDLLRFFFIFLHRLGWMPFAWLPPLYCLFGSKGQEPLGKFGKFIAASGSQEKGVTMKSLQAYTRWKKKMAPQNKSDLRKSVWQ